MADAQKTGSVRITASTPANQSVSVDGVDMIVRGATVHLHAGDLPRVELDLDVFEVNVLAGPVRLHVSDETRALLLRHGWTPPRADHGDEG